LAADLSNHILESLDEAVRQGYLNLEWISPERFSTARELRSRFLDKPTISFTDLTSMVVMKELGIKFILTDDNHFVHVGMGFQKAP
jgi:predicted nucleic acid-binding protein